MMLTRRLGRTDLDVSVLCFGGNVFGWTADEATSCSGARRLRRGRRQLHRHGRRLFPLGARQQGRRVRDDPRQVDEDRGNRKDVIIATKVGARWGRASKGLSRGT